MFTGYFKAVNFYHLDFFFFEKLEIVLREGGKQNLCLIWWFVCLKWEQPGKQKVHQMKFFSSSNCWDSLRLMSLVASPPFSLNTLCVKIVTQLLQNIKIDVPKGVNLLSKKKFLVS